MSAIAILGFLSGLAFCFAGFPAAWRAIKDGCTLVPPATTASLLLGLSLGYAYLHATRGFDPIVLLMYGTEFLTWVVIINDPIYLTEDMCFMSSAITI